MQARSPLDPMLRKLEARAPLGERDRQAVLALPHTLRTIEAGQYVYREGDRAEKCCLLRSGFAYRHKIVGDGSRQIVGLHIMGDLIDLQDAFLSTVDCSVQALSRVELVMIPRAALQALAMAYPAAAVAMWVDTLVDAAISREWVVNIGRRDSRARMAHLLCEFALRQEAAGLGDRHRYELPMTQEQLADTLGLTPVHVNRTLKSLEADGLLARRKRSVIIADWDKLSDTGDFNSGYLNLC